MFMLIIWLQGIWLPQHGYDFAQTPLWAGIYILPLTLGMLIAGPTSGYLSDRYGPRWFATGGMLSAALSFVFLALLPIDFPYPLFAAVLFMNGVSMGMFASPNRAGVMNSLPPGDRGAGGGMNQTFQNSAQVLSVGIFFTLMILGLAAHLPQTMASGLEAHGVPHAAAVHAGQLPPVSILFAAFLGYNPIQHLVGASVLGHLPAHAQSLLTGRAFFPHLISAPFRDGLHRGAHVLDHRLPDRRARLLLTRSPPTRRPDRGNARPSGARDRGRARARGAEPGLRPINAAR